MAYAKTMHGVDAPWLAPDGATTAPETVQPMDSSDESMLAQLSGADEEPVLMQCEPCDAEAASSADEQMEEWEARSDGGFEAENATAHVTSRFFDASRTSPAVGVCPSEAAGADDGA